MAEGLHDRIVEVLKYSFLPSAWGTTSPEHVAGELIRRLGLAEFTCGTRSSDVAAERWWATAIQTVNEHGEWEWPKI